MEISLLLNRFHSPSLVSRLFFELDGLWTSVALSLAAFAAVAGLLRRVAHVILRSRTGISVIPLPLSYSSDDDESCSASSFSSDDEEEEAGESDAEDDEIDSTGDNVERQEQDCNPGGGGGGASWSDLGWGGAVVRTWEGLGLGFDLPTGGLVSLLDLNSGEALRSFLLSGSSQIPASTLASPAVVLTAAPETVKVWDARAGGEGPAAEWQLFRRRRVAAVGGCGEDGRVYIGDDAGGVMLADLRGGRSASAETWNSAFSPSGGCGGSDRSGSVVAAWCRNAARYFPVLPSPK